MSWVAEVQSPPSRFCGFFARRSALAVVLAALLLAGGSRAAWTQDPGGLAGNDFGNNGEGSVPKNAYEPGKKQRESKEYKKENPDGDKRDYYEKGGKATNHDSRCRAKTAYKAARYSGPKNGYEAGPTDLGNGRKDGPRPKAGGGNYLDEMPTDPAQIIRNIYKYVEDITYPKRFDELNGMHSDTEICDKIADGTIDIGTALGNGAFVCVAASLFFDSLVRELGFPVQEKNVLPSLADGRYDVQTAACDVWYDGAWHFFDPWESFTDTEQYLTGIGHAGYGNYHDVDIWVRESPPDIVMGGDYAFDRAGTPIEPQGWKKIKHHKRNGATIETETFTMRMGVQDPLGRVTGGVGGVVATDIPASIYVPHDRLVQANKIVPPGPETYGEELVTLMYPNGAPASVTNYHLLVENPTASSMSYHTTLEGSSHDVAVSVSPATATGVLAPHELRSIPFQVTIGSPLTLPPPYVETAHVASQSGSAFHVAWSPVGGAVEYRVYARDSVFESTGESGVTFLGATTDSHFVAFVPHDMLVGVESIGPTGLQGGLDPENGSTTLASFTHTLSATAAGGGTISPSGTMEVPDGGSQTYAVAPGVCPSIADVFVDGVSIGPTSSYTFTGVTSDHTLLATFGGATYTITAGAGAGGSITPSGAVEAGCGSNQTFDIVPSSGNHILDVTVDGVSVGNGSSHTFTNVSADHTIAATFAAGDVADAPNGLFLEGGNPNPSSGATTIVFGLSRPGSVKLAIYDLHGRSIRQLVDDRSPAGHRTVSWDGRDHAGATVPPGIYMVRMQAENRILVRWTAVVR